jgi:hypothetical protein
MRNGTYIWHCRLKNKKSDIKEYLPPQKYTIKLGHLTLQPASGYTNTILYGTKISETWIMMADERYFRNVFHVGDVLYIDGNEPDFQNSNYQSGKGANAVVDWIGYQNLKIRIVLKAAEF